MDTPATCSWIRKQETVLIHGLPGVRKTPVAVGRGVQVIANGFLVAFRQLADLWGALFATACSLAAT